MSLNNAMPSRHGAPATAVRLTVLCLVVALVLAAQAPARTASSPTVVDLSLQFAKVGHVRAGDYMGVSPGIARVHVGDQIVFANTDSRRHTATGLGNAAEFPENPRWTESALKLSGQIGAGAWSSGEIAPGARSAPLVAAKPGTYLYGCFFDYSTGMRGEIIVEP